MISLLIILLVISFVNYARKAEKIDINEWFTKINTKRNRIIAIIIILLPVIRALTLIIKGLLLR